MSKTTITSSDCRTADGIAIGLIDGIISMARVLRKMDISHQSVSEALADLRDDEDVNWLFEKQNSISLLNWTQTALSDIKHNGKPVTTETWEANTITGNYKVYRAPNGNCFVNSPDFVGKVSDYGHNQHVKKIFSPFCMSDDSSSYKLRTPCDSIEHGKRIAEQYWQELASTILASLSPDCR